MSVQLQPEAALYLCVLAAWFGIRTPYALAARRDRRALHPIYTHHLLFSLAQLLVLHNGVVAGFAIASCLLVYFIRIPAEERALVDEFGESYRTYMGRTGRVLPRPACMQRAGRPPGSCP